MKMEFEKSNERKIWRSLFSDFKKSYKTKHVYETQGMKTKCV